MSRGFVKEDDQEENPFVPPRAYLPEGVTNFVTQAGMNKLLEERQELLRERDNLSNNNENERRIALNFINAKLRLLDQRISSAKVADIKGQPGNEIRFGAIVTIKEVASEGLQTFQIVGVDEADISIGKVSFISPLARILINKKAGEKVTLKNVKGDIIYIVEKVIYLK
jgi:transcription elongation factor GreB